MSEISYIPAIVSKTLTFDKIKNTCLPKQFNNYLIFINTTI